MICSKLALPRSVNERAATIYRKALTNDLVRGRSIDAVVAARRTVHWLVVCEVWQKPEASVQGHAAKHVRHL